MEFAIKRFDFDGLQDFKTPPPPIEIVTDHTLPEAEDIAPPPPPSFSEKELQEAKALAWDEGHEAGTKEEEARQATQAKARDDNSAKALQNMMQQLTQMQLQFQQFKAQQTEELGALVMMLVRKVAGDLLAQIPEGSVAQMIDDCLAVLQTQPKIIAYVHPDIMPVIEEKLRHVVQTHHLENSITLKSDATMLPSEARIVWPTGSAERNMQEVWTQIETIIGQIDFSQLAEIQAEPETIEAEEAQEIAEAIQAAQPHADEDEDDITITQANNEQGESNE